LIHGLGWDHALWAPQIEWLAQHFSVLAADTRGHGDSDKPPGPYSIRQFADDWIALLDALEIRQAAIGGFSQGGMIAQEIALKRPDLVSRLVLAGTTCKSSPSARQNMMDRLKLLEQVGATAAAEMAAASIFSEKWRASHPAYVGDFVKRRAAQDQTALAAAMMATTDFDTSARLRTLGIPVGIVIGLNDTLITPDAQREIGKNIPAAKIFEIENSGHMVSIEQPEAFDRVLRVSLGLDQNRSLS
jgi:pimeloyl-ACP methyl ester carboxylesterase